MVSEYTYQTYSSIFLLELLLSVSHVVMVLSSSSLNGCVVDIYSLTRGEIITEIETLFHRYSKKQLEMHLAKVSVFKQTARYKPFERGFQI